MARACLRLSKSIIRLSFFFHLKNITWDRQPKGAVLSILPLSENSCIRPSDRQRPGLGLLVGSGFSLQVRSNFSSEVGQ